MKERCTACRFCCTAVVADGEYRTEVPDWCRMKGRRAPKNPCRFWRPKAQKEADTTMYPNNSS
jgi:hypothetical protein